MLADDHAVAKAGQGAGGHPSQTKRRGMAAQRVIGRERGGDLGRVLRHAVIDDAVPVAIGPAIKGAVLDRGQIVGRGFVAEAVTLVHHGPQGAGHRLPCHADGVAQPAGKDADLFGLGVEFIDAGAALFDVKAVVGDVGVGADADIKL